MEKIPDWLKLWRDLVEKQTVMYENINVKKDGWKNKAKHFDKDVKKRWAKPDSSREFVLSKLTPGSTIVDIGAGTGSWAILLAKKAKKVTAIEPSESMIEVMKENADREGVKNLEIIQGYWPEIDIEDHDFSLCSHAMYGVADFASFVQKMNAVTRDTCYLLMRIPTPDGLMAKAALEIWGQPYDSPNFPVAFNAMLQIGMNPNVLIEDTGLWRPWTNQSLEEALHEVKRRLVILDCDDYDDFLLNLLKENLKEKDGEYIWPKGVSSGLIYWKSR